MVPSTDPSVSVPPLSARLLVIDDDRAMLSALSTMLEVRLPGAAIETCTSGEAALERIILTDYDAIVSDMPGMDGLQLMERVQRVRPTNEVQPSYPTIHSYKYLRIDGSFINSEVSGSIEIRALLSPRSRKA